MRKRLSSSKLLLPISRSVVMPENYFCAERGIGAYGGGQTELGVGRDHIQYLAALFHPDTPNDVAPREYNLEPGPGLPASPLTVPARATGFLGE